MQKWSKKIHAKITLILLFFCKLPSKIASIESLYFWHVSVLVTKRQSFATFFPFDFLDQLHQLVIKQCY